MRGSLSKTPISARSGDVPGDSLWTLLINFPPRLYNFVGD